MDYLCSIAYVILHYITIEDTFRCVDSIKKNSAITDNYKIIIVDNASPNNTYNQLWDKYNDDECVVLIKNEKNLGFAQGNNVGISCARNEIKAKFIMCINSDIVLLQTNLLNKLEKEWINNNFAVLGPMIYTLEGRCDINPVLDVLKDTQDVKKLIKRLKKQLIWRKFKIDKFINLYFRIFKKNGNLKIEKNFWDYQFQVKLHGCALIFSPTYFEVYDGFNEKTFLYLEEDFLYYQIMKSGLVSEYDPDIILLHREHSSTKKTTKDFVDMLNFRDENCLQSAKALLDTMILDSHE